VLLLGVQDSHSFPASQTAGVDVKRSSGIVMVVVALPVFFRSRATTKSLHEREATCGGTAPVYSRPADNGYTFSHFLAAVRACVAYPPRLTHGPCVRRLSPA
jgi:hypothetical protein